jgi:acetyl esterase/lipase
MLFNTNNAYTKIILGVWACLALARVTIAQPATQHPERNTPVAERLAAIPNLDPRLTTLEKALNAAKDKTSLSATTARYTLEIFMDALANPKAYEARRPVPKPAPGTAAPAQGAPAGAGAASAKAPPAPSGPSKVRSDYVSPLSPLALDLEVELKRAEQIATAVQAGRDPMAGITGDVHLAYRSNLDGMLMPYRVYVPTNYSPQRTWPLVVFLHGALCDENTFMNSDELQPFAERLGYLVVSVNGRGPRSGYTKESGAQQDVFDVMSLMEKYYHVDSSRIFLTGHSMGGMGTWSIGLEFRDKFAALAPEAGTRNTTDLEAKLARGKKIPILITVGGKDTAFPPEPAIEVYQKLKAAGYPTKIVEYPLDEHNPVFTSSTPEVFAWFEKHGNNK